MVETTESRTLAAVAVGLVRAIASLDFEEWVMVALVVAVAYFAVTL